MAQYMAWLEKQGYYENTVYPKLLSLLVKAGGSLSDPESVKQAIADKKTWKDSVKALAVDAYNIMVTEILKTSWTPSKYTPKETLPFIPEERELEQLIASCKSRRMSTFLQTLKETYADPGEVLKLEWKDVNANVITINAPVKGHNPGQIEVSNRLIVMLNSLPKTSKRIFPVDYPSMYQCFLYVRKRAAARLENPRLLQISFKTFRHWGGSMIAHYTNGNVMTVIKVLRHKNVQNTMKYIHMIHIKDDKFDVATASTVDEVKQLASAGFEKVDEMLGIHVFRRPKRFNAVTGGL